MFKSIRWKVVVALLISVSIPLGASIYFFGKGIVRAYSVALNRDVETGLQLSIESQRDVFTLWKKNFRLTARMHAVDEALTAAAAAGDREALKGALAAFLDEEEPLLSAAVVDEDDVQLAGASRDTAKYPDDKWRRFEVRVPLVAGEGEATLVEVYTVPWEPFHAFDKTGETLRTFETSLKTKENITGLYYKVYVALVGASVLLALVVAFLYVRGFSRRIRRIAEAAVDVGKGNLDVEVKDRSGDEVGDLGRTFDMMVKELKESRERISYLQKISAWQEIARRLAHEIKNPLTPIQLSIQQMKSTYKGDDEDYRRILEESAQIAQEEIESLRRLTTEFSSFARLPGVTPKLGSLNETMSEMIAGMEVTCRERGVTLEVRLSPRDADVKLDRMMFKRVMDNLILNGLEAIERAAAHGADAEQPKLVVVQVSVDRQARKALITVADTGEGIREEDRDKIFMPYFTKRREGTGLGLAIVKKIVLEHGGEVVLSHPADPGLKGACFTIELPLAEEEEAAARLKFRLKAL